MILAEKFQSVGIEFSQKIPSNVKTGCELIFCCCLNEESNNKNPNESIELNEEGEILRLPDILNEQHEIDEEANAILGESGENFFTYPKRYIKRQVLHACLTCVPESKEKPVKHAVV